MRALAAHRRAGAARRAVPRRPRRRRHAVLPDGEGRGPRVRDARAAGRRAGRAARDVRGDGATRWRRCTASTRRRSGSPTTAGPGNYFARQIARWSKQWAASRTRDNPGARPADRVAARAHPRRRRDGDLPRRLPDRQPDVPPDRAARGRGARLGAVDARPSARRPRLQRDGLAHAARRVRRPARPRPRRRSAFRRSTTTSRRYVAAAGRRDGIAPFHVAFALFRFAVIFEGIAARAAAATRRRTTRRTRASSGRRSRAAPSRSSAPERVRTMS